MKIGSSVFGFATPQNPDSKGEKMSIHKLRKTAYKVLVGALLVASAHFIFAQNESRPQEKASETNAKSGEINAKSGEKKAKSSAESCDGALDIVPVKSSTFARKRRPGKAEAEVNVDAKPDPKTDPKNDAKPEKQRQNEEKP